MLGLLAAQPANCYELDQRLQKRFRSAEFSRGTAKQAIKRFLEAGLVRKRALSEGAASAGGRVATVYELTESGFAEYRRWLWSRVQASPIREELIGKVGLSQPADVQRMIEVTREAERDLMTRLDSLNYRVRERRRELDPRSWPTRIDLAISCADHAAMNGRVSFVQQLHRHLVEELS